MCFTRICEARSGGILTDVEKLKNDDEVLFP